MRIDLIITELNVGGAERCLTELAIGLHEAGDDVRVFSIGRLPDLQSCGSLLHGSLLQRLTEHGIEVQTGQANSLWNSASAYRRMADFIKSSPPDLCQTFLFHANVMGTLAARRHCKAVCVGGLRVAENRRFRCQIESRAVAAMDALVCVSDGVARFAKEKLSCPDEKRYVIANSVDAANFRVPVADDSHWEQLNWPPTSKLLLFVGRMHSQKGLDLLQNQIDQLAPAGSDQKVLLIGEGPLAASIDQWCDRVGGDRVQRIGFQSDVRPWMQMCQALILPSRYEGMPNVVMEAMACSKPVVVARVEGVTELLPSPEHQIFEIGDHGSMSDLACRFLSDERLCESIGHENQQRITRDYSVPAMIDSYRSLYRKLLQQTKH